MAESHKGVLVTCDIPTMQVIKFLDRQDGGHLIIKELDDTHVLIQKTFLAMIHQKMEELHRDNHYER